MTAQICSNDVRFNSVQFRRLSDPQRQKLYWAALEVLERTGVRMHLPEAVELMRKGGASITEGNRVRIPAGMVERALSVVPKRITLYDRNGRRAMPVDGYRSFFGPGSDCLNIIDHRTGERRQPTLQDVREAAMVADALPRVNFVMSMFLPVDVPQMVADRYQMEVMLHHTSKPIVFVTNDLPGCIDAVEMAEAAVGGPEMLQQRPMVACYINVTTGLRHNQEALEKLLYLSKKRLPAIYVPSSQGGITAPVTVAGSLLMVLTGALAGLVLSQLNSEGAPFIMPGWAAGMLDMRTMVMPYADPDRRGLAAEMAHFLGLPMFSLGGCSDAKTVEQQAGIEAALTLMTDVLSGGNIVHDLGYLESGMTGSLAQLVICDEILAWLGHFAQGLEITDETLALDLIDEVGPDGQFLDTDHTLAHYKDRWYPDLFERNTYEGWLEKGAKTLGERAADKVDVILQRGARDPLPAPAAESIRAIVEEAYRLHGAD
jgi:trimethylamine---corrinoid protein Co-methyltransferase